jgi:hypothetical protein
VRAVERLPVQASLLDACDVAIEKIILTSNNAKPSRALRDTTERFVRSRRKDLCKEEGFVRSKKRKFSVDMFPLFFYTTPENSCLDRDIMKDKTEVIKHSAAIQIQNSITLLQRRAWNILLAHAYEELPTAEEHHISIPELTGALGYTSRNDVHLREALIGLMTTVLEWNLIGKDNAQIWGATTLIAHTPTAPLLS